MFSKLHIVTPRKRLKSTAATLLCTLFLSFFVVTDAEAACPNGAFSALGNPVELVSCTEAKAGGNFSSLSVSVPANVANGELLVLAISKDDDEVPNVPSGWTSAGARIVGDNDGYLRVFTRISDGSEPGSYTVTWSSSEDAYAYMMRFTGASGLVQSATDWGNNGTPQSPAVTALIEDTLILRMAAWDRRPVTVDPGTIMTGHTNITQDRSRDSNNATMGGAAYTSQEAPGSSGTGSFQNSSEQWAAVTLGIEPIQFRLSMPDSTASVCGVQAVTLSVTDRLGNPMTWFSGTVTLSTSSGSTGDWFDAGSLSGTLNNGTANDGVATYQFAAGDNGVATFNFNRQDTGTFSFDVDWGAFEESSSYDPSLTIDNSCRFRISHDGNAGTCSVDAITISVVDSENNPATYYSGTITVGTDTGLGDFTLNSGGGTFDALSGDGTNDGEAEYEFPLGENQVVLDLTHTTANADVNFSVTDAGNPTFTVDGAYDPDLNVAACSLRFSHSGSSTTCSAAAVTLTVVDGSGATLTGFTGTVNLSVSVNDGNWGNSDGAGTFTAGASGTATYEFVAGDSGDVVLSYSRTTAGIVNFNATSDGFSSPTAPYDDDLNIGACTPSGNPCPNPLFIQQGYLVELASCTENINAGHTTETDVPVPSIVNNGDLLVLLTAKDDDELVNTPAGWNLTATQLIGDNDGYLQIFTRISDGAEPSSYNITWTSTERTMSTMMRYTGASGVFLSNSDWGSTGTAVSPSITTLMDDTLILRTAGWDRSPVTRDPATIISGHTNINQERAGGGNGGIMHGAAYINQASIGATGTANFEAGTGAEEWATITLGIEPIQFRFSMPDNTASVCGMQQVTVSVTDRLGNPMTWFRGTVSLSTSAGSDGDWLDAGSLNGTLDNGPANDGEATYTFAAGDNGVATFNFYKPSTGTFSFDLDWGLFEESSSYDPTLTVDNNCRYRIAHDTEGDICTPEAVTISVVDSEGVAATHYSGTIRIETDTSEGDFTLNTGGGTFDPLNGDGTNDGEAEYEFVEGSPQVILNISHGSANADVNFNISDSSNPTFTVDGAYDPDMEIVNCVAEISVNATTNVCSPSETITITVRNSAGSIATDFAGLLVLDASTDNGDYALGAGASGTLDNGAGDDGVATYQFSASDNGVAAIEYSTVHVESLSFSASSTYITFDSGASSENLQVLSCEFRIAHSVNMDNCTPLAVTISVFNANEVAVTDYVGTVNLTTSTTNGTWSNNSGNGTVTDPVSGDGSATYEFVSGDSGSVVLNYSNLNVEHVNLNVSDGVTTDSNASYDANVEVEACTFRIVFDDGEATGCSFEQVTISVYDSGGSVATGFTGTATLETDTIHGTWSDAGALNGTLTETTPGDGVATYTFVAGDNGVAVFNFSSDVAEELNIDVTSGDIEEDGAYDPVLEITGCVVALGNTACYPGSGGGTGNLTIGAQDPGRMVVMIIWHIDSTPQEVQSATFDGENMTLIYEVDGGNTAIEMWGILDEDLPASSGSYAGAYTWDSAPAATPSMCMVELENVDQDFPVVNGGTPTLGEVNGSTTTPDGAPLDMSTTITTTANNALILTAGLSDFTQSPSSWFNSVAPNPPMSQLFFNNNNQNPVNGTAGGSSGIKPVKGLVSVTDTDSQDATSNASHIVSSFNPRVAGDADVEGYIPVELYETLSGNIGYKAIGTSLRTTSNTSSPGGVACEFVDFSVGRAATLAMPASSTVRKAYLYWAGSGEEGDTDDTVTFGPTGSEVSVTADETFMVEGAGGSDADYFAAYKDVTSQVTANGSYTLKDLVVQTDSPWNLTTACAGGWALVVVYDNAKERFKVANVFHGFQPFQNSSFALVPRNFRFATTDDDVNGYLPSGEITHITLEGDETLATGAESLGIQNAPGSEVFTALSNSFNPPTADFNSTVTRPLFWEPGDSSFYEWDEDGGLNGDGYEIDQAGDEADEDDRTGTDSSVWEIGESWGFDIDTHFLKGNTSGTPLYNFSQPGEEAEQITTQYSSGQDLVILIAEVITVTNFDLADLEIFKTQTGDFTVDGTGAYHIQVKNNGNGGVSGGFANGHIVVADVLPTGLTLASVSGTDWSCTTSANAFTCEFDIATDCNVADGCAASEFNLSTNESLPTLTANVNVADTATFPLLTTNVKNVARLQHNGGNCPAFVAGQIPDPVDCDRAPQFDNVNDLDGGAIDVNDLDDKTSGNNNVHSIVTEIRGIETDLSIVKDLVGILEVGEEASYTLTVTNNGPDATSSTFEVSDLQPTGVTFTAASGTGWSCTLGPLDCEHAGSLGVGASAVINLTVDVTGTAGQNVTNTAQVTAGNFNFDTTSGNNSSTDVSSIVAPPVSSSERFLISVRVPENTTEIGGLDPFENHDYIIYNPLTDSGTLFYDDSAKTNALDDADAVHLYKNGHLAISAKASSTVGTSGDTNFEPEDIVRWDPITDATTLLFDGSAIFDGPIDSNQNIDAVYVKDDGKIVFSVEGSASITYTGPTTLNFERGDIVQYDPSDGSASILVDASDSDIFNGDVQVDGIYIRVDDSDSDANKEVYILSVDAGSTVIGACGGCDPSPGTTVTRDDIVELDLTGDDPVTENLFVGNLPLGVFTNPSSSDRTIDAIHTVEDGYIGHFAISQSQAGNTCEAGQITIRKHEGLTHDVDTDYSGSILITTSTNTGDWSIAAGNGTLQNGTADDGAATYTFVPADNGEVTLYLTVTSVSTVNVDVSNGFVAELGSEDPNFTFNNLITAVTYRDNWGAAELDNNDGSTFWEDDWVETDGAGAGLATGNIVADNGELEMTATPGDTNPSMEREADLSLFELTEDVYLNLDYRYQFLNSGSDVLNIDVSLNGGSSYSQAYSFSGIGGTNLTPQSLSLNLSTILSLDPEDWTADTVIRFRIGGGYTGTSLMFFDNIELATGTNDCGIGSIDHYEIRIGNTTGSASTIVNGLQCLTSEITVTGHDAGDFTSAPGESITLTTSTGRGDWRLKPGQLGTLNNGTPDDGIATFIFAPAQQAATFIFNYTNPSADPEDVNFNITTSYFVKATEDPTLRVHEAGLLFYNETLGGPTSSDPIPTQISGKPSNVAPSITILNIEGVRSSDNDPLACSPIFDAGNTLTIEFAAECIDPGNCSSSNDVSIASLAASNNSATLAAATNNSTDGTSASYQEMDVLMASQPGGRVGGEIYFSFEDAGQIELHAQYQVPLNNDASGVSGYGEGYLRGSSEPFVVRPFGFDIDFTDDRFNNGTGGSSYAADADGDEFETAGIGFSTTVSAVVWEQADDANNDGVPDAGAALGNNAVTPNFGNESTAGNYEVLIERERSVLPLNSTYGDLTDNRFDSFSGTGLTTHSMTYDEVGIIDLTARLVDDGTTSDAEFLDTVNIYGNVKNVGRFIPGHFELTGGVVDSRPLTSTEPRISSMPGFTYMGEEFGISATITVYNGASPAAEVQNYVGSLAFLGNKSLDAGNVDLAADKFVAVDSSGSPVDLSARLGEANQSSRNLSINWEANPSATSHAKTLSGNLIFGRANPAAPDGPLTLDIGLATTDPDDVGFTLDLDVDDGAGGDEAVLIQAEEYRYGRLLVDNAYGSELEELGITFTIEYWDSSSSEFVVNTDDSTTTLLYNASENVGNNRTLFFVSGTFTDNLVEDINDVLEAGESFIEATAISGDTDVKTSFYEGRTILRHSSQNDTPFYASAPGEDNDGTALIEFDLDDSSLPYPLDFLSYGWRGAAESEDINNEANDYSDNPRGQVGFGSFRGHDLIINWQEIFTPP